MLLCRQMKRSHHGNPSSLYMKVYRTAIALLVALLLTAGAILLFFFVPIAAAHPHSINATNGQQDA